jgi:hypothetical protein
MQVPSCYYFKDWYSIKCFCLYQCVGTDQIDMDFVVLNYFSFNEIDGLYHYNN